jgi:F5/8 type C domain
VICSASSAAIRALATGHCSTERLPVLRRSYVLLLFALACAFGVSVSRAQTIRVDITPDHSTNTFVPNQALGAGIDRMNAVAIDKLFTEDALNRVLSAGWQTVSYRQNTELHIEDWHWNPKGTWSDPSGKGYFTGSAEPTEIIRHSYGYPLPHRGATRNDGTDATGYGRLTDGDLNTYWKSNPYLTKGFTGEGDSLHPQWIVIDLANSLAINAIRIAWTDPYAKRYRVQYWTGEQPIQQPTKGSWITFPGGAIDNGQGGTVTLPLSSVPMPVRYLRIWMTESSNTCDTHGSEDRRNCVGFAIRELYVGTVGADGLFHDSVLHTPDQGQTTTWCSSVDPWHEPANFDSRLGDQVGLDLFYTSGATRGLPAMIPIAMVFNIPEDAAAQITYLEKRKYPISYVEMGEEPDGQFMLPEDYAALYVQFADALHKVDPSLKLGGPVFTGQNEDIVVWPDAQGRTSWTRRFVDYLRDHGHLKDLAFFPFEHYPFIPCTVTWNSLYDEPRLVSHILDVWHEDGVPQDVPMFITESNISWQTDESFVDIFGALWLADYVGAFLTAGGKAVYYFHYLPMGVHHGCNNSMGTFGMFTTTEKDFQILQPTSQYFGSQLINLEWVQPGSGEHRLFRAAGDLEDPAGHALVTAYATLRPDGQYSLMVVNRDQWNRHKVRIAFHNATANTDRFFAGQVAVTTFGRAQYQWHPDPKGGSADPDGPAVKTSIDASADTWFDLPEASMSVLRGTLGKAAK